MNNWKTYYMTNDRVLEMLSILKNTPKNEKKQIQEMMLEQLSYLVYKRVRGYKERYFYNDLVQEGKEGLLKSLEDFDSVRGMNFFKFAIWHIQHRITAYLRCQERFTRGFCKDRIIDSFMPDPHEAFENKEAKKVIRKALYKLLAFENKVITMRFGINGSKTYTLQQIGDMFSVSKQYIKQVESKAICKLRKNNDIREFYGERL